MWFHLKFAGYIVTSVAFNPQASTQGSQLTVSNPTTDKTFTCKVHYNQEEVTSKNVILNVYGNIDMRLKFSKIPTGVGIGKCIWKMILSLKKNIFAAITFIFALAKITHFQM